MHVWRQIYQFLGASNQSISWGVKSINFLGNQITGKESITLPSKVHAIIHHPKPHNVRVLQELLGIINFHHRLIPNAATTIAL